MRKEFRGLGIINLWDLNSALLIKWWWKSFDEPGHKWVSLISHNYWSVAGWWFDECINGGSYSPFWKRL